MVSNDRGDTPGRGDESLKQQTLRLLEAAAVFAVGAPAVAATLFFPVMYLAGAHSGVLSGLAAGTVWIASAAASIALPTWLAIRVYRRSGS